MKILKFILTIFLLVSIAFSVYYIWLNMPTSPIELIPGRVPDISIPDSTQLQFYPNMRYRDKTISYYLEKSCSEKRISDIEKAFSKIQEKTILQFRQTQIEPEIKIMCSKLPPPTQEQKNHFIAGEGGPTKVINTTLYAVIFEGSISLFRPEICEEPTIAIHEILHSLGFDHSTNKKNIMYPITDCKQSISNETIKEINSIYQNPSFADLKIEELTATKSGRYVSFNISIINEGLKDIQQTELILKADKEDIKTFQLNKIEIGTTKFLAVTNLAGPRKFNTLTFQLISTEPEISLDNNQIILTI